MKIALWISKWGYPFGGGEEFMYQSMRWAVEEGYETYWISFSDFRGNNWNVLESQKTKFGATLMNVPGGLSEETVMYWLKFLNPAFVHNQGHSHLEVVRACYAINIPIITGFHFWIDAIESSHNNIKMLENSHNFTTSPCFEEILKKSDVTYLASEFMQEVISKVTGYKINNIIHPVSDRETAVSLLPSPKYITMVDVHPLKGGEIFYSLVLSLPQYHFYSIMTQDSPQELCDRLSQCKNCVCSARVKISEVSEVYRVSKIIILGSLVDETYSRVASEAMMNSIPVVTTGNGNIKNIVGDAGIYVKDGNWKEAVISLMEDQELYFLYQRRAKLRSLKLNERKEKEIFFSLVHGIIHVMFFVPWCDQGLGIQARSYCEILKKYGIKTYIFAFRPYWSSDCLEGGHQKDKREWEHDHVYYSQHNREEVTDEELLEFIDKFKITHCLIPETCFDRVFTVSYLLSKNGVKVIAIPNIEIVRRPELPLHRVFYKIFCNNHLCKRVLERAKV